MLLLGSGLFEQGVRAYQAGRFREALDAFLDAETSAGSSAAPELLHNAALAALGAGELVKAEYLAEKAVARGGRAFIGIRDFLHGSAAFKRCETAEARASGPEAEPFAYEEAIAFAESALANWQRAAMSRPDWPEARRNAERALLKLEELKDRKEAAEQESRKTKDRKDREVQPELNPLSDPERRAQEVKAEPRLDELSSDLVQGLLEKLEAKEEEKREQRRARQVLQRAGMERDW